jgi:hypothetical protein
MPDPASNWFEIERRAIAWSPLSTLNDKITPLGYDGDPNLASPVGTPGEQWLYNLPIGQFYKESNATLWWKSATPNTWINLAGGGSSTVTGTYLDPVSAVSVGDAVYVSAANTASQADASTPTGLKFTVGICIAKPSPTVATVQYAGEAAVFGGTLTAGDTYYLDTTAGQITNNVTGHGAGDAIQIVGVAKDTSTLVVHPQFVAVL